jgi:sec-independent protein translocase protein TatB
MFDIAFTELLIIGVVALIVIGPERLPKVARTVGAWLGRLNRYVGQVKQDIDREMKLDELRKVQKDMQDTAQRYEIMANQRVQEVESSVQASVEEVGKTDEEVTAELQAAKLDWPQLDPALADKPVASEATPEPLAAPQEPASASKS